MTVENKRTQVYNILKSSFTPTSLLEKGTSKQVTPISASHYTIDSNQIVSTTGSPAIIDIWHRRQYKYNEK